VLGFSLAFGFSKVSSFSLWVIFGSAVIFIKFASFLSHLEVCMIKG
jgi:hypothetical protein